MAEVEEGASQKDQDLVPHPLVVEEGEAVIEMVAEIEAAEAVIETETVAGAIADAQDLETAAADIDGQDLFLEIVSCLCFFHFYIFFICL